MKKLKTKNKHWYKTWIDWSTLEEEFNNMSNTELEKLVHLARENVNYLMDMDVGYADMSTITNILESVNKQGECSYGQFKWIKIFLSKVITFRNNND